MTWVYACDHRHTGLTFPDIKRLVGGKAANLAVMSVDLDLPVPPAFTITTDACNEYLAHGWPAGLDDEMREHMARIEDLVGRRFGDPANPLLVSVRSGAAISMPGMMDTILNLGLTLSTTEGLAAASGSEKFAANCRMRLVKMFRDVVGVDDVPDDPWVQLRTAVEAVFRSWNGDRARTYREREGIPHDLGTAVTIQAMVFGNRSVDSGTGVLFTRNPSTGEPEPYGDVMYNAQGEDVVAGTHRTEPIAVLEERLPAVARQLHDYAGRLESHHKDMCDIEFTIEHGTLWLLQCRIGKRSPQAALRIALDMAKDPDFPLSRADAVRRVAGLLADPPRVRTARGDTGPPIATGLPASPGVACGEITTTSDAAVEASDAGRAVLLVRSETSPDDVHGMARSAGILTATGGLVSHAAVVARGWGIPAVVGTPGVEVGRDRVVIGGRVMAAGEMLTIDGTTGEVFAGAVAGVATVVPEAATLLAWAHELGIAIGKGEGAMDIKDNATALPGAPALEGPAVTADIVLRSLAVKGYATPESAATALLATPHEMLGVFEELVAAGLIESAAGSFRLTPDGRAAAKKELEADTDQWGADNAVAALDAFLGLDHRMKETVTAWQMREVDGAQTLNDHANAAYDARVLGDLASLHADASAWLDPLATGLPRLALYEKRLAAAAAAAASGDNRYVASPRVDSYHGVWFELHEDLILLAGRSRADEVAAGRA